MGVLQIAPDAPAAGGPPAARAAVARGRMLISEGADIIEVACAPAAAGRPPAHPVMAARQVRAVVATLMSDVRIAVRTGSPDVAAAAVGAGATIITDVSKAPVPAAGPGSLAALAADAGVGWVAVHDRATPARGAAGNGDPADPGGLLDEAVEMLRARIEAAAAAGIEEIYVDPGIGSGRPVEDDLELLRGLGRLAALDRPLVVGTGDGRLIDVLHAAADATPPVSPAPGGTNSDGAAPDAVSGKAARDEVSAQADPSGATHDPHDDRLEGALAVAVWAMLAGAAVVRTHHVAATAEAARTAGAKAPVGAP